MDLKEESKNCTNCFQWLKHCKAECCKEFRIILPQPFDKTRLKKGDTIQFGKICARDKQLYYKLHGVRYVFGRLFVTLDSFEVDGNTLIIKRNCDGLTEDLHCKYHGTSRQPIICHTPSLEVNKNIKDVHVTENCLYKYK